MKHTISQNQAVLDYLEGGQKLTSMKSRRLFGCERLAARVKHLRRKGHKISTELVKRNGKRVAEYSIVKEGVTA